MAIAPIPSISVNTTGSLGATAQKPVTNLLDQATESFSKVLDSLNQSQQSSDSLVQQLSMGGNTDLHSVMIGMEENDVNFRVALAIRDKLVDSYREVMRMQI
jgi:flagellar hook-basal body complex protein FliE